MSSALLTRHLRNGHLVSLLALLPLDPLTKMLQVPHAVVAAAQQVGLQIISRTRTTLGWKAVYSKVALRVGRPREMNT